MKKPYTLHPTPYTLFLILIMMIILSGCGGTRYSAEKLYWQANRTTKEIARDKPLDELTTQEQEKIINAFRRVVEKCPLEPQSAQSQFIITQIYILQNRDSKARKELVKITQNFSRNTEFASRAQFMLGNLYENQGNWDEAVLEYEKVTDLFPLSNMGLRMPIYIAEYYQRQQKKAKANKAYHKAVTHYKKLINEYSGTSITPAVKDYLALAYVSQKKWNEAIAVWQTIINEYPQEQMGAALLFAIGETYLKQIKDLQKAIQVYEEFVQNNPTSKIIRYAKFQIARLYFIKEDFAKARQEFNEIITDYPEDVELCTNVQLALAGCYEEEGKWAKAIDIYNKLKADHPGTRTALNIPLFIARHYLKENQTLEAERAFKSAISGYEKFIKENSDSELAVEAQDFISLSYISQQKWDKAIGSLKALVETYPETPRASRSLFTAAAIYQKQLAVPEKAIEMYEEFIERYPRHRLTTLAKSEIESLRKSVK